MCVNCLYGPDRRSTEPGLVPVQDCGSIPHRSTKPKRHNLNGGNQMLVKSLGLWRPRNKFDTEWQDFALQQGFRVANDCIRGKKAHRAIIDMDRYMLNHEPNMHRANSPRNWHRDDYLGGVKYDGREAFNEMIVWANETPTEIRLPDGDIFQGDPFEVICLENDKVWHRMPKQIDPTMRLWARATGIDR